MRDKRLRSTDWFEGVGWGSSGSLDVILFDRAGTIRSHKRQSKPAFESQ